MLKNNKLPHIEQQAKQEQNKSGVSVYAELKMIGRGLMDTKWKLIIQKGKDQKEEFLKSVNSSEKFWLLADLFY